MQLRARIWDFINVIQGSTHEKMSSFPVRELARFPNIYLVLLLILQVFQYILL